MNLNTLLSLSGDEFVSAVYRAVLGREPDQEGLQRYVARMRAGHSKASVIHDLLRSKEAHARSGLGLLDATAALTDEEFVTSAFQALLGRSPDPAGHSHYTDNLKKNGSRERVIKDIGNSKEARARRRQVAAFRRSVVALLWQEKIRRGSRGWWPFGRHSTARGSQSMESGQPGKAQGSQLAPDILANLPIQARLHYGRLQRVRQSLASGER